ncbi:hypothetical protein L249_6489 [Ophiocordyceps polyrhachis-furcata BCC 54312]|uniref:Uncharacterized protein n=1 Tax=Ophiocordyceps polyrhachis-furcata BCC 54312 TaxID=1330021 RepID=A0A367LLK2_9HYPO|nr:hypothetical protein L249_6489 [Ophiocordyceps polyrhachis-furcata BCC 54312]
MAATRDIRLRFPQQKMIIPCQCAARSCSLQLRSLSRVTSRCSQTWRATPTTRRFNSTQATAPASPKIAQLVEQISQLTLLETADLSKLNIPDMPIGGFAAAAGPAPAVVEEAEEEAAPVVEKSLFTLKLMSIDAAAKAKIIKEVKAMLGLSLVESKKFVESAPKMMKENVAKEEGEGIVAKMKELGAVVVME